MMSRIRAALLVLLTWMLAGAAAAQTDTTTYPAPWNQLGSATLSVSNSSSNVALSYTMPSPKPRGEVIAYVCNTGGVNAYVKLGNGSSIAAATTDFLVVASVCNPLAIPGGSAPYLAAITAASSTSLNISIGIGSPIAGLPGAGNTVGTCTTLAGDVTGTCAANTVAKIQGTTVSGTTGSGNVVFSASPVFSGNVGIGTASPQTALSVQIDSPFGQLYIANPANAAYTGGIGISKQASQIINGDAAGDMSIYANSGKINFSTDDGTTDNFVIDTSGKVGIANSTPTAGLLVVGNATAGVLLSLNGSAGTCNHTPGASAETVSCSSDERLKTDIEDYTDSALSYFSGFKIKKFKVAALGDRSPNFVGIRAQEMMKSHPELVHLDPSHSGYYTVDQPNPYLYVRAIQEMAGQIADLKQKVAELSQLTHGGSVR